MNHRKTSLWILSLTLLFFLCLALFPEKTVRAAETISSVSVTIEEPAQGGDPDYTPEFPQGAHYYSGDYSTTYFHNDVCWYDTTYGEPDAIAYGSKFEMLCSYQVRIFLTAESGYAFSSSTKATVNDKSAVCEVLDGQLFITFDFPIVPQIIDTVSLTIAEPEAWVGPDYEPELAHPLYYYLAPYSNTYYKNDICWKDTTTGEYLIPDEDVFEPGHSYHVFIYLTPGDHCKFAEELTCVLNGEVIETYNTLAAQLRIDYDFPALRTLLESASATITEPVAGMAPDTSPVLPDGARYTVNGVWMDVTSEQMRFLKPPSIFQVGHTYRLDVYFIPEENCLFSEDAFFQANINGTPPVYRDYEEEINAIHLAYVYGPLAGDGWMKEYGHWFYYENGQRTLGWKKIQGVWYYLDPTTGEMKTGWQKISGKWYYLASSGAMQTGWQKINGKWYYLNSSGVMQTGWQKINQVWYYFNAGGDMVTGWMTINKKTYYFKGNGAMAANEWCGGWWLNADGTWTYKYKASWKQNAKGWWYGDTSGWYAKSCTIKIDNKNYSFDANGYMK